MDHNMVLVLGYDYSSRNRPWRQKNVHPLRVISMAMAVRRCDTERIAQCSMTRLHRKLKYFDGVVKLAHYCCITCFL
jgi:hypothetical protein